MSLCRAARCSDVFDVLPIWLNSTIDVSVRPHVVMCVCHIGNWSAIFDPLPNWMHSTIHVSVWPCAVMCNVNLIELAIDCDLDWTVLYMSLYRAAGTVMCVLYCQWTLLSKCLCGPVEWGVIGNWLTSAIPCQLEWTVVSKCLCCPCEWCVLSW